MRKVLIVLVVLLVVGVIAADRIGVMVAQNEISSRVAAQYNLPKKPDVSIGGFPFLTQAVAGKYDEIDVNIGDWTQQNITVHDLQVKLSGLSAPLSDVVNNNTSNIVADTATASAIVPYDTIKNLAPHGVDSLAATPDGLELKGNFQVGGFNIPATIVVKVAAAPGGVAITPVSVKSSLGPAVPAGLLKGRLGFVVPIQNLPIGSRISQVDPTPTGLKVAATANNVHFSNVPTVNSPITTPSS